MTRLNALLNNEAKKRIECGELPRFGGEGRDLLVLSRSVQKARTQILWIRDQWCSFSSNQLSDNAKWVAQDWIQRVGTTFRVGKAEEKHSITSLAQLICRKVKQARKQYLQDKVAWELKLANARLENEKRDKSDAAIRAMIDWLVTEAQRYMVSGGRLRELGNTKPPGNTPAETWHLMSFEQFNKRAVPQQIHKEETKDANGYVVKGRTWCENPGGGEIAAAVEQSHFMLRGIARHAERGSEEAMKWLYHLAMDITKEFWLAVEAQRDLARRMSASWKQVPIHWNDSPGVIKKVKAMTKSLQMPKPPSVSLKVQPDSPHQQAVSRVIEALNFLMRSPPIFMPPTPDGGRCNMLDDCFPGWLKKAFTCTGARRSDVREYGEILWEVYVAAMTAKPDSPWKKQSRPRKAKEKFIQALLARKAKTP